MATKVKLGVQSDMRKGKLYSKEFPFKYSDKDKRQIAQAGSGIDKRKPAKSDQPMVRPITKKIKASPN